MTLSRTQSDGSSWRQSIALKAAVTILGTLATLAVFAASAPVASASSLPVAVRYWTHVAHFGMYGNATTGDCSLAAIASLQQVWDVELGGSGKALPAAPILATYASLDQGSDEGLLPAAAFSAWEQGISGVQIASVASIAPTQTSVERAIWQLGSIYAVVNITGDDVEHANFPTEFTSLKMVSAWTLTEASQPNAFPAEPHAVAVVGYDKNFVYLATWGSVQPVTWSWWNARVVQTWAILPTSFAAVGHSPTSSVSSITSDYFSASAPSQQSGPYAS